MFSINLLHQKEAMEVENTDNMMEVDWELNWEIDELDYIETYETIICFGYHEQSVKNGNES